MGKLEGKTAIITGASSGIGAETARLFASEGANVILIARNRERSEKIVESIREKNGSAQFFYCDIRDEQDVHELGSKIRQCYEGIDILFNNAGVFLTSSLEDIKYDDWNLSFQTNVDGTLFMIKEFMPLLINNKGNIVNNASISGLQSWTSGTKNYIYGASKAAVIKLSNLCALNYAGKVRVNCVCPGIVDTEIFTNRDFSRFDGVIPIGYIAKPIDVAKVVLFLSSDDAAYVTGAVIPVDGGMSL